MFTEKPLPKDFVKCPWCREKVHLWQIKDNRCPNCRGIVKEGK